MISRARMLKTRSKIRNKKNKEIFDRQNENILDRIKNGESEAQIVAAIIADESRIASSVTGFLFSWLASFLLKQFILWLVRRMLEDKKITDSKPWLKNI